MKRKVFLRFLLVLILWSLFCFPSMAVYGDQFKPYHEAEKWAQEEQLRRYQLRYESDLKKFLNEEFDTHGYEVTVKLRNGTVLHGYILNKNFKVYVLSLKQNHKFPLSKIRSVTLRNILSDKIIFKDGTEFKVYLKSRFLKIRFSYNNEVEILETFYIKSIFFGW